MNTPILNIDDLEFQEWSHGERFDARLGAIGQRVGAQKLGYNLTVLAPGKAAFPFHCHRVNEEMFFVLDGNGEIRIGENRHQIKTGDVIACPPGGPESAHQIVNTSDEDLRYLAVSTQETPEIAEYPDSKKFGILHKLPAEDGGRGGRMLFICRDQASLEDYWAGE